jgi:hypothetical protein
MDEGADIAAHLMPQSRRSQRTQACCQSIGAAPRAVDAAPKRFPFDFSGFEHRTPDSRDKYLERFPGWPLAWFRILWTPFGTLANASNRYEQNEGWEQTFWDHPDCLPVHGRKNDGDKQDAFPGLSKTE